MESFDRTKTIEENWPQILRPLPEEVDMLDCSIDVTDMDMPVEFEEYQKEHIRFYYMDFHQVYYSILKHFQ